MKKKILAVMIVSAMLVSSSAAMAETTASDTNADANAVLDISEQAPFVRRDNLTVVSVEDGIIETADENGGTIFLNTSMAVTYKIDGTEIALGDIKEGDVLTAFDRSDEAVILIYPPVYSPVVIIKNDESFDGAVTVSNFKRNEDGEGYINAEGDLIVHLPEGFKENKKTDNDYIVFYTRTTMSIPPQTPADKVVVLEEKEEKEEKNEEKEAEASFIEYADLKVVKNENGRLEVTNENDLTIYFDLENAVLYENDGTEISAEDIKEGDSVAAYTRADEVVAEVYPETHGAVAVIKSKADYDGFVKVSNFTKTEGERAYISSEKDLVINLPEDFIENRKTDNDYIVFYTVTTRSIPPQTTPDKLVLLDESRGIDDEKTGDNQDKPKEPKLKYKDITEGHKFYQNIEKAVEKGLFKGISEEEFAPEGSMTRAMFVTVLGRLDGLAVKDACVTGFEDTPGDQYYSSYVAWANTNNIVKGYEDGSFKPDKAVTRDEAMQILWNYCAYKGISPEEGSAWAVLVDYADAGEISEAYTSAAMWNVINKFMEADDDNSIRPKDNATRAEIANAMIVLEELLEN